MRTIAADTAGVPQASEALPAEALAALNARLRHHITRLVPRLRKDFDRLWRGSLTWSLLAAQLDAIQQRALMPTPAGDRAARCRAQQLAHDCQWLLDQHREGR